MMVFVRLSYVTNTTNIIPNCSLFAVSFYLQEHPMLFKQFTVTLPYPIRKHALLHEHTQKRVKWNPLKTLFGKNSAVRLLWNQSLYGVKPKPHLRHSRKLTRKTGVATQPLLVVNSYRNFTAASLFSGFGRCTCFGNGQRKIHAHP